MSEDKRHCFRSYACLQFRYHVFVKFIASNPIRNHAMFRRYDQMTAILQFRNQTLKFSNLRSCDTLAQCDLVRALFAKHRNLIRFNSNSKALHGIFLKKFTNKLVSFMIKNIDEFKKNVIERSTNWMQNIFMLFEKMNVIKKLKQKTQQEQTKTVIQLKKQKRQNVVQTQKLFDLQFRLIDIENQLLFNRIAVNDLIYQKIKIIKMKRCKN